MNAQVFQQLPSEQVQLIVQKDGEKVCVFPVNGTRRWFLLTYGAKHENFAMAYLNKTAERQAELFRMMFEHGIQNILIPVYSHYLQPRGEEYVKMAIRGLENLVRYPALVEVYKELGVQVRFYGNYETYFRNTPYAYLIEFFHQIEEETAVNHHYRLWWGVCADDAMENSLQFAIDYYQTHNKIPDKQALIRAYYGIDIPAVNIFISSGKPRAFDMPLIMTGREDLYFTVAPSLSLNQTQLRAILHDHLYNRPKNTTTYAEMTENDWEQLHHFYHLNQDHVLGVGAKHSQWGIWHPIPQVTISGT